MNISSSSDESVSPFLFSSIDFFIIAVEPVSAIPIKMDASFYLSKKTFNKSRNCLSRGIDVFFFLYFSGVTLKIGIQGCSISPYLSTSNLCGILCFFEILGFELRIDLQLQT